MPATSPRPQQSSSLRSAASTPEYASSVPVEFMPTISTMPRRPHNTCLVPRHCSEARRCVDPPRRVPAMHRAAMVTTLLPAQPKPANVRNVCDPILLDEVQAGRREHDVEAYLERSPNRVKPAQSTAAHHASVPSCQTGPQTMCQSKRHLARQGGCTGARRTDGS